MKLYFSKHFPALISSFYLLIFKGFIETLPYKDLNGTRSGSLSGVMGFPLALVLYILITKHGRSHE
jgi:hypothetical protein